jgi:hypothetical protein
MLMLRMSGAIFLLPRAGGTGTNWTESKILKAFGGVNHCTYFSCTLLALAYLFPYCIQFLHSLGSENKNALNGNHSRLSIRPSVTYHQKLNRSSDFHEIRCGIFFTRSYLASSNFVKII